MPTKIEKDAITGRETTGHEWDGVRELNTPLPTWWLYVFYVTIVWSIVIFILYPAIPYGTGYFKGLIGYSQRKNLDREIGEAEAKRAGVMDRLKAMSTAAIRQDQTLLPMALIAGKGAFANNCQPCHGAAGSGRPGYPTLAADSWIWGGTLADIEQTINYGIRSGHQKGRDSQMPRFGADGLLTAPQIDAVADYVLTLYGTPRAGVDTAAGAKIFKENCAVCHGEKGEGGRAVGAPRLASRLHLYGSDRESILRQIAEPRMGVMPAWSARLDQATIKSLVLYVHGLGGGE